MEYLRSLIRDIPDFPKPDIIFKDITPVLQDPEGLRACIDTIAARYANLNISAVVGMESRGFIFGAPIAYKLGCGFIPVRKPGKLPYKTLKIDYCLEYGTDSLEIHADSITPGANVLIVDDLLATGGTAAATVELVEQTGGKVVGCAFVVELDFLKGRAPLIAKGLDVFSLVNY